MTIDVRSAAARICGRSAGEAGCACQAAFSLTGEADGNAHGRPLLAASRERRSSARHRRLRAGDAGHSLGLRLLHRRRGGDRSAGGRRHIARRRRIRHQLRRAAGAARLAFEEVRDRIPDVVRGLVATIPAGVGARGAIPRRRLARCAEFSSGGPAGAIDEGYGDAGDLERAEEGGCLASADPDAVSETAVERGAPQLGYARLGKSLPGNRGRRRDLLAGSRGTLRSRVGRVTFLVHSGSRGLGYQVCDDSLAAMGKSMDRYRINVPDRQLACAPIRSTEGRRYLGAMGAAANFASANRQIMTSLATRTFEHVLGVSPRELGASLLYDVCHNVAKLERHRVDGRTQTLCVHRKGATRALGAAHRDVPRAFRDLGQPVLVPGDMGRGSYVLVGTERAMNETFGSSCHGAGRVLSRAAARRRRVVETSPRSCRSEASRRSHTAGSRSPKRCPRPTKTYPRWSRSWIGRVSAARSRSCGRSASSRAKLVRRARSGFGPFASPNERSRGRCAGVAPHSGETSRGPA